MKAVSQHGKTVDLLTAFAMKQAGSNVTVGDPNTLATWLQTQLGWQSSQDKKTKFLNDLTDFFSQNGMPKAWNEKPLQAFDVKLFSPSNQGQATTGHGQLLEDMQMAQFVWTTLLKAQESVADFRGRRILDDAKKAGLDLKWEAPAGSKGGETVAKVLG
jgi:hypothetical protein